MPSVAIRSITAEEGRSTDPNIIWFDHVSRWTWIVMGAKPRTVVFIRDGLMVDIYMGSGIRKRRLVIKVNGRDLYDIEIGRLHRRTREWIPEAQTRDIYCDQLDEAIRDLYDANKA
jgi:hypothetical protein